MYTKTLIAIVILCMLPMANAQGTIEQNPVIKIGGLFPLTGALSGGGIERNAAARMAVDNINANDSILNGYTLEMIVRDTQTYPTAGAAAAQEIIADGAVAIVGAASSAVSKAVAEVAAPNKIPQVSYSSSSPELSNKTEYPYFMRMISPDPIEKIEELTDFLANQTEVATIYEDFLGNLSETLENHGFKILSDNMISFGTTNFSTQLNGIRQSNATTIILNTLEDETKNLLTQINEFQLQNRLWIQIAETNVTRIIHNPDGTPNQNLIENANGTIWLQTTYENPKTEEFKTMWQNCNGRDNQTYQGCGDTSPDTFAPFAYDAVYTIALAIDKMIQNGQDYNDGELLLAQLYNSEFQGMSGKVTFNEHGDRTAIIKFNQLVGTQIINIQQPPPTTTTTTTTTTSTTTSTTTTSSTPPTESSTPEELSVPMSTLFIIIPITRKRKKWGHREFHRSKRI